jgi:hypothetical protein
MALSGLEYKMGDESSVVTGSLQSLNLDHKVPYTVVLFPYQYFTRKTIRGMPVARPERQKSSPGRPEEIPKGVYEASIYPIAARDLAIWPADRLIGLDRIGDRRELALFLGSLRASLKHVGALDQERMHRVGLS